MSSVWGTLWEVKEGGREPMTCCSEGLSLSRAVSSPQATTSVRYFTSISEFERTPHTARPLQIPTYPPRTLTLTPVLLFDQNMRPWVRQQANDLALEHHCPHLQNSEDKRIHSAPADYVTSFRRAQPEATRHHTTSTGVYRLLPDNSTTQS